MTPLLPGAEENEKTGHSTLNHGQRERLGKIIYETKTIYRNGGKKKDIRRGTEKLRKSEPVEGND